ncbi:hypothetical protein ACFQZC_03960 [Streptacidiphilus monticola]
MVLTLATACGGKHDAPNAAAAAASASTSAEAAHEAAFARAWTAAVARRKGELDSDFTAVVQTAIKPYGLTDQQLQAGAFPTGSTSACSFAYSLQLPVDRFTGMAQQVERALERHGWQAAGKATSVDSLTTLAPLTWRHWKGQITEFRYPHDEPMPAGYAHGALLVKIQATSQDKGC